MDKDGKFIKDLQDRLQNAEVEAPDGLFEAVTGEMAARGLVPAARAKKKPLWAWFLIPAAAAAVLVAVVLFRPATSVPDDSRSSSSVPMMPALPQPADREVSPLLAEAQPSATLPSATLPSATLAPESAATDALSANSLSATALSSNSLSENSLSENSLSENSLSENSLSSNSLSSNSLSENSLSANSLPATVLPEATHPDGPQDPLVAVTSPEEPDTLAREVYAGPDESLELELEEFEDEEDTKRRKRREVRFDTDFQVSGVVLSTDGAKMITEMSPEPPAPSAPDPGLPSLPEGSDNGNRPGLVMLCSSRPAASYAAMKEGVDYNFSDMMHRLPVKVSATAGFQITDWFRITTGLTYSYLRSDFKMNVLNPAVTGNREYRGKQQLHYMGLPLNLQFRLFQVGFFSAYVSAGAAMEGLVSGRRSFDDGKNSFERLKDPSVFFSLNGALGLNFHLYGPLNLYFEPGVSWYFRNECMLDNAYNAHQFNVSMNFGLRFDLK